MADGQLLVVDDEHEITDLLEEHFRACGYDVDVAHDGAAALVTAAARRPDAVLLDVTMPGPDGAEVLARLRALDPRHSPGTCCGPAPSITCRSPSGWRCSSAWWRRRWRPGGAPEAPVALLT